MEADRQSFDAYVRARTPALSRTAYLLTGDHHRAEDLVQQTFLRVAGRWRAIVAEGDPDAYVRKVLYNEHISWWRHQARRIRHVALAEADQAVPDRADEVSVTVAVQRALRLLGPRQRAALVLRYFEDRSEAETAAVLGCRIGTVKSQVRDGLARLRALAPELADLLEVKA